MAHKLLQILQKSAADFTYPSISLGLYHKPNMYHTFSETRPSCFLENIIFCPSPPRGRQIKFQNSHTNVDKP